MFASIKIQEHSDALVDLLIAQCADLEKLLELARAQSEAVAQNDFERVFRATEERANLGERLEVFSKQTADLRRNLGANADSVLQNPIVARAAALIAEVLAHDDRARPLLVAARETAAVEVVKTNQSERCVGAYSAKNSKGLARDFTA